MRAVLLVAPLLVLVQGGCRFDPDPRDGQGRQVFRVGYLPALTHAPALYGLETGLFARALGEQVVLRPRPMHAGPSLVEALFAGELDVAYIGPSPAINGHQRSLGRALRVVAGSTEGGAQLVVQPHLSHPDGLLGQKVASPAVGNTQDVALRLWLSEVGLLGTGGVQVVTLSAPDAWTLFRRKELAGAWVAEPWASRLVVEASGRVLVDEKERWPQGRFPTVVLVASTAALERRPELVEAFIAAHREAVRHLAEEAEQAHPLAVQRLERELGQPLSPKVLARALGQLRFTTELLPAHFERLARDAQKLGFLRSAEVAGMFGAPLEPER